MKKLWILLIPILCVFLSACGKTPDLYEYATSLDEADLLVREDGTVWRITGQEEIKPGAGYPNYTYGDVELVRELDSDELNAAVTKTNADDMSLWEYAVCTWPDDRVAVAQDGNVWWFYPEDLWKNKVRRYDPAAPISEEEIVESFWLDVPEVVENFKGEPALKVVFHSEGEPTLVGPEIRALEVMIDGEWHEVPLTWATTADVKFFEGGIYTFKAFPLFTGDYPETDIPIPSGHYRFIASAYVSSIHGEQVTATVEFDLGYKNGEYKIK